MHHVIVAGLIRREVAKGGLPKHASAGSQIWNCDARSGPLRDSNEVIWSDDTLSHTRSMAGRARSRTLVLGPGPKAHLAADAAGRPGRVRR